MLPIFNSEPVGVFVNNNHIDNQLSKNNDADAGLDLHVDLSKEIKLYSKAGELIINDSDLDEIILPSFSRIILNTSINIAIPYGYVGLLWDRSGLATIHGITILGGCIDSGYTGDVKIVLFNSSYEDYIIHNNDKMGQMLTVPVNLNTYDEVSSLEETNRGTNGFNSSGY